MIDRKIPQSVRDQIPLLTLNEEIAGVLSHPEWYVTASFVFRYNTVIFHNRYTHVTVAKI
jgi:hypothetical protein